MAKGKTSQELFRQHIADSNYSSHCFALIFDDFFQ